MMTDVVEDRHAQDEERLLRDTSELEGTLLPTARPIENVGDADMIGDVQEAAAATPATYFDYSQLDNDQTAEVEIIEAPAIPGLSSDMRNDSDRERHLLHLAQQRGMIDADREMEDIRRAKTNVFAVNYYTKEEVRRGNQRASDLKRKEDAGALQTSATVSKEEYVPPPPEHQTKREEFKGTYGSEYKVKEYELGTEDRYETADYEVSEYKSIYES